MRLAVVSWAVPLLPPGQGTGVREPEAWSRYARVVIAVWLLSVGLLGLSLLLASALPSSEQPVLAARIGALVIGLIMGLLVGLAIGRRTTVALQRGPLKGGRPIGAAKAAVLILAATAIGLLARSHLVLSSVVLIGTSAALSSGMSVYLYTLSRFEKKHGSRIMIACRGPFHTGPWEMRLETRK